MSRSTSFGPSPSVELALETEDPAMDALTAEERRKVGDVWLHRAQGEMTAAVAFSDLARDLFLEPAAPSVRWLVVRAAADEMQHAELCRRVASRYLGTSAPLPEPRRYEPAAFGDCPESLNRTLRVVLQTCLSEAIGSAMLKTLLDEATSSVVRSALRELLKDEIDHARIGYAHLASGLVSANHKEHVRRAIPTLVDLTRRTWLVSDGLPPDPPRGHGGLARDAVPALLDDALSNLVLPGLEAVL
jgi:hypothetical protein